MTNRILIMLMLSLISSVSYAMQTMSSDEIDVLSIKANIQNSTEFRDNTISADITGHVLTITFNDNVGIAHIIIKDSNGVYIDRENVFSTPDYATFIIDDAGYYRMDITLSNSNNTPVN